MFTRDSNTTCVIKKCKECSLCIKDCAFLSSHGSPGFIARSLDKISEQWSTVPFECSLCGLCTSICPRQLDPSQMFLELRTRAMERNLVDVKKYKGLLKYESRGMSSKYSLYHLPAGCDTVFFPGCSLPGGRPGQTLKTYEYLRTHIENMGVVLDCCSKPSHDLGRRKFFIAMFTQLKEYLIEHGISTIIVACPNCYKLFKTYAAEFLVTMVYEILADRGFPCVGEVSGRIVVHDPCPTRFDNQIHESVYSIVKSTGLEVVNVTHAGQSTLCCGEGGGVGCIKSEFASVWTQKRLDESGSDKIVTYCAGCANLLARKTETFHLIDLVFELEKTVAGRLKISKPPFTYWNRLKFKKHIRQIPAETIQTRPFIPDMA